MEMKKIFMRLVIMKSTILRIFLLVMVLAAFGVYDIGAAPKNRTGGFTEETIKNEIYRGFTLNKKTGFYEDKSQQPPYSMHVAMMAFGDLNNDGVDDAAVICYEAQSHEWPTLRAVINNNGKPEIAAAIDELGDRIPVKKVAIDRGIIIVHLLTRCDNEPMSAEPTVKTVRKFKLVGKRLVDLSSKSKLR
jgi:hypothetical protein